MNPIDAQLQTGGKDLLRVVLSDPATGIPYGANATGVGAPVTGYTYDTAGRIATYSWTANGITQTTTYTYDTAGRITSTVTV